MALTDICCSCRLGGAALRHVAPGNLQTCFRRAGRPADQDRLVQPNIDQAQKWDPAFQRETMDRYRRLTERVAPGIDLIIWPEAATPFLVEEETHYRLEVAGLVHDQDVPLLFFLHKLVEGIGDFEAGTVPAVLRLPAAEGLQASHEGANFSFRLFNLSSFRP